MDDLLFCLWEGCGSKSSSIWLKSNYILSYSALSSCAQSVQQHRRRRCRNRTEQMWFWRKGCACVCIWFLFTFSFTQSIRKLISIERREGKWAKEKNFIIYWLQFLRIESVCVCVCGLISLWKWEWNDWFQSNSMRELLRRLCLSFWINSLVSFAFVSFGFSVSFLSLYSRVFFFIQK